MARSGAITLQSLFPADLAEALRRESIGLPRPIRGRRHGMHASARAGVGLDFRDHRPYVPGDDPRMLDWRAIARRDRLVLRRTETEDELEISLVIDASGAMAYGEGREQKLRVARSLAAALAWIGLRQGDRVGLITGGANGVDEHLRTPASSHEHTLALAHTLADLSPRGSCPWPGMLDAVARRRKSGLLIFVSDFLDPGGGAPDSDELEDALWRGLGQFASSGHRVAALQILHRDELEFAFADHEPLEFRDPREQRPSVEGAPAILRAAYLERLHRHLQAMARQFQLQDVLLHRVITDEPLSGAAISLLAEVSGRRALARATAGGPR